MKTGHGVTNVTGHVHASLRTLRTIAHTMGHVHVCLAGQGHLVMKILTNVKITFSVARKIQRVQTQMEVTFANVTEGLSRRAPVLASVCTYLWHH